MRLFFQKDALIKINLLHGTDIGSAMDFLSHDVSVSGTSINH